MASACESSDYYFAEVCENCVVFRRLSARSAAALAELKGFWRLGGENGVQYSTYPASGLAFGVPLG